MNDVERGTAGDGEACGKAGPEAGTGMSAASGDLGGFSPRCLSLDLEVGVQDSRIRAFAALRPDTGQCLVFPECSDNLAAALAQLDALAAGA